MNFCHFCRSKIKWYQSYHVDTDTLLKYHTDCIIEKFDKKIEDLKADLKEKTDYIEYLTKYAKGSKPIDENESFQDYFERVKKEYNPENDKPTKTAGF